MSEITQEQVDVKALEIYKKITNHGEFVMSNYTILNNCSYSDLEYLLFQITKNTEFKYFETFKVISLVLAFGEVQKRIPTINELL